MASFKGHKKKHETVKGLKRNQVKQRTLPFVHLFKPRLLGGLMRERVIPLSRAVTMKLAK
jgi:hypothetical protein